MPGETDLTLMLKTMSPRLNSGDYVFCTVNSIEDIDIAAIVSLFREQEGITIIIKKELANSLNLGYDYVAAWITLSVHSSLSAIGLTKAVSAVLANEGISCNVVAAYYHDHIFVAKTDAQRAITALEKLTI